MGRLLLVSHRSIEQDGGPAARWRAFASYLPEHGWETVSLSATEHVGAAEFDVGAARAVSARAAVMDRIARVSRPAFRLAGLRPDALPLSMLWIARGALLIRRRIEQLDPDLVLATGPPLAGPLAARLGVPDGVPTIVELRDLWAGNPAFDAGGPALSHVEDWLLRGASRVVACTPEAVLDLRRRHPDLGARIAEIPNGFDPRIWSLNSGTVAGPPSADGGTRRLTVLHSGTLTAARPLTPLIRAMGDPRVAGSFRLVLHGHLSPASRAEVERATRRGEVEIELLAPSPWEEAVTRIGAADACLVAQSRQAGDETAVASKIYEYLALGKRVLCVTDGGASEALLRRLGADELCARLDVPETIVAALVRVRNRVGRPVPRERLEPYNRRAVAARMATLLEQVRAERASAPKAPERAA